MHDRPPTVDFAQPNSQANFEFNFVSVRFCSTTVNKGGGKRHIITGSDVQLA